MRTDYRDELVHRLRQEVKRCASERERISEEIDRLTGQIGILYDREKQAVALLEEMQEFIEDPSETLNITRATSGAWIGAWIG